MCEHLGVADELRVLMTLEAARGQELAIRASGADAEALVAALEALVKGRLVAAGHRKGGAVRPQSALVDA